MYIITNDVISKWENVLKFQQINEMNLCIFNLNWIFAHITIYEWLEKLKQICYKKYLLINCSHFSAT